MSVVSLWSDLRSQLLPVFSGYRARISELPIEVKADRTLLTEADIAVQKLIVDAIRSMDADAVIIAEEDERTGTREEVAQASGRVWVIDPIDGTAEFVRAERTEFCSVVCVLEDWQPAAAFVLAPEMGTARTPLLVTADAQAGTVTLDGQPAPLPLDQPPAQRISATRSRSDPARPFDVIAEQAGYQLKTRTTSQTLDMLRTAVDLTAAAEPPIERFDLFWRRNQKVWDGLAGLCLGAAAGLRGCDEEGRPHPLGPRFLSAAEPVFPSTVMGRPETVAWFLEAAHA